MLFFLLTVDNENLPELPVIGLVVQTHEVLNKPNQDYLFLLDQDLAVNSRAWPHICNFGLEQTKKVQTKRGSYERTLKDNNSDHREKEVGEGKTGEPSLPSAL